MNNNFTRKFNIKGFSSRACLDLYIALSLMPNAVKRGMADKEERKEGERCTKEGRKETIIYLIFYELSFPPQKKAVLVHSKPNRNNIYSKTKSYYRNHLIYIELLTRKTQVLCELRAVFLPPQLLHS